MLALLIGEVRLPQELLIGRNQQITSMPSITYNRTESQQPQSIIIKGYVVHPGLHILSHEQMKLVREQIRHDDKLEYLVSQGVIKLSG